MVTEEYCSSLSRKKFSEAMTEPEKLLAVDALGVVMISHGQELSDDNNYGESTTPILRFFLDNEFKFRSLPHKVWPRALPDRDSTRSLRCYSYGHLSPISQAFHSRIIRFHDLAKET